MASATGNTVQHWRAKVNAYISATADTQVTIVCEAYWCSIGWGYDVAARGEAIANGSSSGMQVFNASSSTGQTREIKVATKTITVTRGDVDRNITCTANVQVTGGYHNGTSAANVNLTIPAIAYQTPSAPSNVSASRNSDTQASVSWNNNPSGILKKYAGVFVERQVDNGSFAQVAALDGAASNYVDNGIEAHHRYAYRVRAKNNAGYSAYAASEYIYTTPAEPVSVAVVKRGANVVEVKWEAGSAYAEAHEVERSRDGVSWDDVTTEGSGLDGSYVDDGTPAGGVVYRVRARRDGLYSGWVKTGWVTTVVAPDAPTVVSRPASVLETGSVAHLVWSANHPDGSEVSSSQLEIAVDGGAAQTVIIEGAATEYDYSQTASPATVSIRIRTHGLYDGWGAWSGAVVFTLADVPQILIPLPASDGAVIDALPCQVAWEIVDATGVAAQSIELLDRAGAVVYRSALAPDSREFAFAPSVYMLQNNAEYTVRLTAIGGSSLSGKSERSFRTEYEQPVVPTASISYKEEDASASVQVFFGSEEGKPQAEYASVARILPNGDRWLVADRLGNGEFARDPLPPLNQGFTYLVTVYALSGAATAIGLDAMLVLPGTFAVNAGADASRCALTRRATSLSRSSKLEGTLFTFADGGENDGLPEFYPSGNKTASVAAMVVCDQLQHDALMSVVRSQPVCWIRDPLGNRERVHLSISDDVSAGYPPVHSVGLEGDVLVFREANNG